MYEREGWQNILQMGRRQVDNKNELVYKDHVWKNLMETAKTNNMPGVKQRSKGDDELHRGTPTTVHNQFLSGQNVLLRV